MSGRPGAGSEILLIVASWVITTALTFAVVLLDERRLSDDKLERAWIPTSRTVALVWLGVLALPFHFAKTRGDWRSLGSAARRLGGFVAGVAISVLVLVVSSAILEGTAFVLGIPLE